MLKPLLKGLTNESSVQLPAQISPQDAALFGMQIKDKGQPEDMKKINVKGNINVGLDLVNSGNETEGLKPQKRPD